MGGSFSTVEYRERIQKFQSVFLSSEDNDDLNSFLVNSDDFYNVFTTCTLEDFRKIKEDKSDNIVYLISFVSIHLIFEFNDVFMNEILQFYTIKWTQFSKILNIFQFLNTFKKNLEV